MADVKMLSVISTDFGDYVVPDSVAAKIREMPTTTYFSPYTGERITVQDLTYPPLARYYRRVSEHLKRKWLSL